MNAIIRALVLALVAIAANAANVTTNAPTTAKPTAAAATSAPAAAVPALIQLNGTNEIGGGDPTGRGTASLRTNGTQVCYNITHNLKNVTMGHIHAGNKTQNGPVVITFFSTPNKTQAQLSTSPQVGCVPANQTIVAEIKAKPANFYVNVHTVNFSAGAIRGQVISLV